MAIEFKSVKGYYFLDAWVMANVIQLATFRFCKECLTPDIDPCHRLFDQMTMAARSAVANIAEGSSRRQTSRETEMRLTDVARASLSELNGDFFSLSLMLNIEPWPKNSSHYQRLLSIQLDRPQYGEDIESDAWRHCTAQFNKFRPAVCNTDISIRINALRQLVNREISILQKMMTKQLDSFRDEGGFAENLTKERIGSIKSKAMEQNAPKCPKCGEPMILRVAKRGANAGKQFWSCSAYPKCSSTLKV